MFNSQEILQLLQTSPKGYLEPQHAMFTESNLNLFQTYKKLGAVSNKEDDSFYEFNSDVQNQIFCNAFGCGAFFDSTVSYHSHYNAMHRFICDECKKSFPTEHFLDLHISENHDSYFMARLERGERLFKCYLEECQDVFGNSLDRKEHCLKLHKFPSNFRFDPKSGSKKPKPSKNKAEKHKMRADEESNLAHNKNHKFATISFGKQKGKTFYCKSDVNQKQDDGKTLNNMDMLKTALDTM